jgi:hypothetical protein
MYPENVPGHARFQIDVSPESVWSTTDFVSILIIRDRMTIIAELF